MAEKNSYIYLLHSSIDQDNQDLVQLKQNLQSQFGVNAVKDYNSIGFGADESSRLLELVLNAKVIVCTLTKNFQFSPDRNITLLDIATTRRVKIVYVCLENFALSHILTMLIADNVPYNAYERRLNNRYANLWDGPEYDRFIAGLISEIAADVPPHGGEPVSVEDDEYIKHQNI